MATPSDWRIALITGGTRGIGLGVARALASEGVGLALNGVRSEAQVEPVVRELADLGVPVHYVQADIAEPECRAWLIQSVRERFGRLDVLINNAGVAPSVRADILEAGEESFERLIRTNVEGPYFLTQLAARWMANQKQERPGFRGCIVTVTSMSATVASVNRGDYCISKAALSMATRLWAVRLAEYGIPVYEVRPGIIETDMTAGVHEKYDRLIEQGILLEPRWGTSDDIGRAVATLVRGDIPYATGSILTLDGGFTIDRL
jgi:3-oxoacyl-[acyl-carrier protein] reductase